MKTVKSIVLKISSHMIAIVVTSVYTCAVMCLPTLTM